MTEPIIVDGDSALKSGMTYDQLSDEGLTFLAHCGQLTMIEQSQHGMKHLAISANECLGMATHIIAEQSKKIQVLADAEEKSNSEKSRG